MRIFFVTNTYTPYSGGVVQSITALVDELRKQGHEVFIITLTFLGKHDDPDYVIRIPCPVRFMYKKNHMAIAWRPTHALRNLVNQYQPDIIHIHHPFLLGASALNVAQKYHIPCIFTHHTLYAEYAHYIPLARIIVQPIIRAIVRRFCNKVDMIIAPSTYVKNYLQSQGITKPMQVIPSPLRQWFIESQYKKREKNESPFFELLLVTRFVPEKNIPFVFEVMRLLPHNFRLTLVGYGNDYEKLQELAFDKLKFSSEQIRFIHKPDQEHLLALYRSAHLFIFPSQTDTQGIVLAESMSQGLPVVALDGPGQRDIIINGINGFIVNTAQEMAQKITMLAQNPELLDQLSLKARTTAHTYNAQNIVQSLLQAYHQLIFAKKDTF